MPYQTDDYIHLPNPDHPESDFRMNNKGQLNIVGTTNFGAGVKARLGLLKGSGKSAVVVYLFSTEKFTEDSARDWLDKHKEKSIMTDDLLNKKFKFTMPLIKDYEGAEGDDGYYHIAFGLSTTVKDLQDDEMTDNAIDRMVEELKKVQIVINDSHQHGLKDLIGPTTDAWRDGTDVMVDLRVRKKWEEEIRDLVDSGTPLGGSIEGKTTKTIPGTMNKQVIDDVKLFGGALTDIPAAWNLRGTAREVKSGCPGSMCTQILKSLGIKDLEVKNVTKNENDSYEALRDKVRAAVNAKFTIGDKTKYWVRQTWPDAVVVEDYDADKLYEITYTINEAGEVELGDPVEVETQYVEKQTAFYDAMLKDVNKKPIGGDNLTKTDETIPEGMDEKLVDKIKALGDEGKQFLKGLLGVEPTESDPTGDPEGEPEKGTQMNKTMMSQEDVKKMLDERDAKFEKTLQEKEDKIESLEKTVKNREKTISQQEHDDLVDKAITKTQKMGNEDVKTEDDLMKHLQENEDFTEEELQESPDTCIKTAMRGWKVASRYIPAGKLPNTDETEMQKMADKHAQKAADIRKTLTERGTQ